MTENRNPESLARYLKEVAEAFTQHDSCFTNARCLALGIAEEMESLSAFIQQHTAVVCPECKSVCCINRHSYHTFDDLVYIYATGGRVPPRKTGIDDSAPCQYLGASGCTIPRSIRPYRCNWYFCAPLLDYIGGHNSHRQYRLFITHLQQITQKRQEFMEECVSAFRKADAPHLLKPDNFLYN